LKISLALPAILFAGVLLLTYGFEVFSFYLTIDEESQLGTSAIERARWAIMEGRWGMAATSFILPNPVVPVVPTALGVGFSGVAWWLLCRRHFGMGPWEALLAASVAGTVPVLAFIFSFSTVALAIGIGNLLLVGFVEGVDSSHWRGRLLGAVAGAAAIGIYDTFAVAVLALAIAVVIKRSTLASAVWAALASIIAFAGSRAVGALTAAAAGVQQSGYSGSFFEIEGWLADPHGHLIRAVNDVFATIALEENRFGLSSPWLAVVCVVLIGFSIAGVLMVRSTWMERTVKLLALAAVLMLPIIAEAIAPAAPLRSMIYLPVVLLILSSVAMHGVRELRPGTRRISLATVGIVAVLSVLSCATISNRLFATAATVYSWDQALAMEIGREKDRLLPQQTREVALIVNGLHSWDRTPLSTPHESLGKSFFDWDEYRGIQFLRSQGVLVHYATPEQAVRAQQLVTDMPAYPQTGWVQFDSDLLIINFSAE
jgi:hypothetical protein